MGGNGKADSPKGHGRDEGKGCIAGLKGRAVGSREGGRAVLLVVWMAGSCGHKKQQSGAGEGIARPADRGQDLRRQMGN